MTTIEATLSASALEIWRGERCLIAGLDFTLQAGQSALVVGPNGSGKTSLLRVLAGLAPTVAGQLRFNGKAGGRAAAAEYGGIAYRGHQDGLKRAFSARENLAFHRDLTRSSIDIDGLLDEIGLAASADRQVRHLSAGQRRRVALAGLKLSAARLWILDEPLTNLDSGGRALVLGWIRRHLEMGGIAVVATHRADELAAPGSLMIEL